MKKKYKKYFKKKLYILDNYIFIILKSKYITFIKNILQTFKKIHKHI